MARARSVCYWPTMYDDVKSWCNQCYACQRRKSPVPRHHAPFQCVAADILELLVSAKGNWYVLVVEDYFTKFVNLYAIADQKATTVAECLFQNYILEHGVMETLHTDMGRQFESDVVKTHTTPYNPKSDGMVERLNRTLIDQLAKRLLSCEGEWDSFLLQVAFAYNTSVHSSTRFTPYFLTHASGCGAGGHWGKAGRWMGLRRTLLGLCSPQVLGHCFWSNKGQERCVKQKRLYL